MQICEFAGERLSRLGFGAMRLPLNKDGSIDEPSVQEMVDFALSHGVNYFDTAYPYHNGRSEIVLGRCLSKHPRDSFYLATKYPGHQIAPSYDPAAIFAEQLKKCKVEYFDFYLLHNVYENSIKTYMDPRWKILDYFVEQRAKGRIKHLGFSAHGRLETMERFIDYTSGLMEFCQIQLNYLDWTLQGAQKKCELLKKHKLAIWVMEPIRGGALAKLSDKNTALLKERRPKESVASWAFRWVANRDTKVILSGMSNLEQMRDNVKTFSQGRPLDAAEEALLLQIAETMKDNVPCTACRYCCSSCPQSLDIPDLLELYNEMRVKSSGVVGMIVEALDVNKRPAACIGCGACAKMCPQNIDIPACMKDFAARLAQIPSWAESSRKRDEEAQRLREKM